MASSARPGRPWPSEWIVDVRSDVQLQHRYRAGQLGRGLELSIYASQTRAWPASYLHLIPFDSASVIVLGRLDGDLVSVCLISRKVSTDRSTNENHRREGSATRVMRVKRASATVACWLQNARMALSSPSVANTMSRVSGTSRILRTLRYGLMGMPAA